MQQIRTIRQIAPEKLAGKRVLIRVDFNVPCKNGNVIDDSRMVQTLPTLEFLMKNGAKIVILTHVGRPEGRVVDGLRVDSISLHLEKLLKTKSIKKVDHCTGPEVRAAVEEMKNGDIVFLENVRFYPEEEQCDAAFSKELSQLGDIFVNDAFAAAHRRHASTAGIADYLPAYAGFLMERELRYLTPLLEKSLGNFLLIVGGAKVDTKIGILKSYFGKARAILIGGALANTFLAAQGYDIGASKYEAEKIPVARQLIAEAEACGQKIYIPVDVIVADSAAENAVALDVPLEDVEGNMQILDIGKKTVAIFTALISEATHVLWNGPMGLYEFTPFASGTKAIAAELAKSKGTVASYVGGGDTVDALRRSGFQEDDFTFVSTGGGATLEFLEGKPLPGITALREVS